MVSTQKRYKSDNFPVLRSCIDRGERLYHVRLYADRDGFLSQRFGEARMRMILAFIESKTTVIDGMVQSDDSLDYLSVICSSPACPSLFSAILNRAAPRAIIEEISRFRAEEYLANGAVRDTSVKRMIPHAGMVKGVHDSKRILLGLLLEYRALLAEYDRSAVPAFRPSPDSKNSDFSLPFLIFELEGRICGVPAYQVLGISRGGYDTTLLRLKKEYGEASLVCSEALCVKEVNVPSCEFLERRKRGYYEIRSPLNEGEFRFTLLVPSLI